MALSPEERWMRVAGPVDVVYSDDHIIVCNKPSGLLSVPGITLKDCLVSRVAVKFGQARIDKMVVHRLDQATSGLVLFARTDEALRALHEDFRLRRVSKCYEAVVYGSVAGDSGEVTEPMRKDMDNPPLQLIDHVQGKPCQTLWSVLSRETRGGGADATRVALTPVTGRSHQLRLHMQVLGHPILGDDLYAHAAARALAPRCLLHARTLRFRHPATGEDLSFEVPPEF
ncbi:pseudouridylate synthase, 23S RNA-specific [Tribonema minus]|uniref:Dual-specificity RNA pseudouridine synthase RluA n=1 Tax=Tribonema minus TaxID=303371 RepID=A0A836CD05_9STRA|nr:pseudouridylate synthase, 23S RNA-specific [Tribonema minus]